MPYNNPIIPGFHPDPSICRVGEDYYLVTSTFEYFPGVPIFHSRDLINWRQLGYSLTRESQLPLRKAWSSGGIFAPTIRYHNGVFYMITTNVSEGGHFIVTASAPEGPWSEPSWLEGDGFDPSLFFDDDGTVYFTHHHAQGITQYTIDPLSGERLSDSRVIWTGYNGFGAEAPHLYKINGSYYLMLAEGGTEYGHMETMARGATPWGPFESCPHNPILSHRSQGHSPIQSTGHGDLVQDQRGQWWMVFLGVRPVGYPHVHHLGRETFLAPVEWKEDGWPVVNHGKLIALEMATPTLPEHPWPAMPMRDDFASPRLHLCWNFLRNPAAEDWSLVEQPGCLRLHGSPVTLSDMASPAWMGRRQQHFHCQVATEMNFEPVRLHEEAGLTIRMNDSHHYEIGIELHRGRRSIFVRRTMGRLSAIVVRKVLGEGAITLQIIATPSLYQFAFSQHGGSMIPLAEAETRYVSTEVAGGFTGVYFAMYACGNGRRSSVPADFAWFDYEPLAV